MNRDVESMRDIALDVTVMLAKSGLTPEQAQMVVAQILAAMFKQGGLPQHTAVDRFVTVIKMVYSGKENLNG